MMVDKRKRHRGQASARRGWRIGGAVRVLILLALALGQVVGAVGPWAAPTAAATLSPTTAVSPPADRGQPNLRTPNARPPGGTRAAPPGFVRAWGENGDGQLGDRTVTDRLLPVSTRTFG